MGGDRSPALVAGVRTASPRGRLVRGGPTLWQAAAPPTHTCTHARTPMSPNSPHTHGQPPPHSGSLAGRSPALLAGPHHRTPPVLPDGVRVPGPPSLEGLPSFRQPSVAAGRRGSSWPEPSRRHHRSHPNNAGPSSTVGPPAPQWPQLLSLPLSLSLSLTLPWRHGRTHGSRHRPPR